MKILGRTSVILLAALLIGGLTFAAVNAGWISGFDHGPDRDRAAFQPLDGAQAAQPDAAGTRALPAGERERSFRDRPDGFAFAELLKPLLVVTLIVAVVAPLYSLLRKRRRTMPTAPPANS